MKTLIALGIAAGLLGCKKHKETPPAPEPGSGSAETGSGSAVAAAPRPSQGKLPTMPPLQLTADPQRDQKVALGHDLFFDERLSEHKDRSCYSCHQNEDGNAGHDPLAVGSGGKQLGRHAPTIWNAAYYQNALYWDGHAPTLEAQAKGAWGGGPMGVGEKNLDKKAAEIAKIPGYKKLFEAAFPGSKKFTADQVAEAISDYERTLTCTDTRYDKYAGGDKTALNDQEQRGLDVFLGKGMCMVCHTPPFFSVAMATPGGAYFNIGIGTDAPEDKIDIGRMAVTKNPADWAAFKPPSLRNVTKMPPYFHNGSVAKLEDAVKIMSTGGIANKNKTPLLADRNLTDAERADLIAFLGALDCPEKLEKPTLPK